MIYYVDLNEWRKPIVPDSVLRAEMVEIMQAVNEKVFRSGWFGGVELQLEVNIANRFVAIHKCNVDLIQEIKTELSTNNPLGYQELMPNLDERVLTLSTPRPLFHNGMRDFVSEWLPVSGSWVAEIQSIPIGYSGYTLMDAMTFTLGLGGEPFESSASIARRRLKRVVDNTVRQGGKSVKRRNKRRM